jgi:hypothetical protein
MTTIPDLAPGEHLRFNRLLIAAKGTIEDLKGEYPTTSLVHGAMTKAVERSSICG